MSTNQVIMDDAQLNLSVEDWISSDSAEVVVKINASTNGTESTNLRDEIFNGLNQLADDVDWRFVKVDRSISQSGLEDWVFFARARIADKGMSNINSRAKSLGRAGLKYKIASVNYVPTKEAYEELYSSLRQKVYGMINNEVKKLNNDISRTVTDSKNLEWRLTNVSFAYNQNVPRHRGGNNFQLMSAAATSTMYESNDMMDDDNGADGGVNAFEVSEKITLTASVILSRITITI